MKKNNIRSSSRRRTPWDDREDYLTPLESFIHHEYKDHFVIHHPKLSETNEAKLLNSFIPQSCKYCGSNHIKKDGKNKNGIQRYYCNDCDRNFLITTNTIFEDRKISITEWIEYLLNLFGYSSINLNSKTNKNSPTTSKYWLAKVFLLLKEYQENTILDGDVQIDETYYSVIKKEIKFKDGKKLRGISNNKYCIAVGCDKNQVYCHLEGKGKPSTNKTWKAFGTHINPESRLINDDEHSHSVLVEKLSLKSIVHPTSETKVLEDKDNPLNKVNHYCFLLKNFLNAHSGFNRDELGDYLNLFVFMMNAPYNKLEKVHKILEMALNQPKKLHFRDYYAKK